MDWRLVIAACVPVSLPVDVIIVIASPCAHKTDKNVQVLYCVLTPRKALTDAINFILLDCTELLREGVIFLLLMNSNIQINNIYSKSKLSIIFILILRGS